jgi:hypothetical protein
VLVWGIPGMEDGNEEEEEEDGARMNASDPQYGARLLVSSSEFSTQTSASGAVAQPREYRTTKTRSPGPGWIGAGAAG